MNQKKIQTIGRKPVTLVKSLNKDTDDLDIPKKSSSTEKKQTKKNQADVLIELVKKEGDYFFKDQFKEAYVAVKKGLSLEVLKISSRGYKSLLVLRYFNAFGKSLSSEMVKQALTLFESISIFKGEEIPLAYRCSSKNGAIYYDLCRRDWSFVKITNNDWQIIKDSTILFKRTNSMVEQVIPEKNSNFKENLSLLNKYYKFATKEDELLHLIQVITSYLPIGHPLSIFSGPQGASKTTSIRLDRALIDPSSRDIITLPKGGNNLPLALNNHFMSCFDNIERITNEESNILCTAVTGGGITLRKLYTDDEEVTYSYKVPIFMNGINIIATKPDLLDRSVLLELNRIANSDRREESVIWKAFEADKAKILGAVFTIISKAMALYPTVKLDNIYRMADYTKWGFAIAEVIGVGGENFLSAYEENQSKASSEALANQPIYQCLELVMQDKLYFEGTATELLQKLNAVREKEQLSKYSDDWPKEPNVLSRRLKEMQTNLTENGLHLTFEKKNTGRRIIIEKKV